MKEIVRTAETYPYRSEYSVINQEGNLGLHITDYHDRRVLQEKTLPYLTNNPRELEHILNFFEDNHIFAVHAMEVLEDLGFLV